jgi:hypothetical protein
MMKRIFSLLGCGLIWTAANLTPNALAADDTEEVAYQPFTIGAEAGTTGVGGSVNWRFSDHVGARAGLHYFSYSKDDNEIEGITYRTDLRLMSEPLAVDIYPWQSSSFRITVGVLLNQNELEGVVPQDQVAGRTFIPIGAAGNTYDSAAIGDLTLTADQMAVSPYLAVGANWYLDNAKHWSLAGEIGVAYTGSPDITLTTSNPGTVNPTDLASETAELEDAAGSYKFYPILKVSVNYSF